GDAFTGFIPVTPGTSYAFSVWGKSATGANLPIGFDPYNSSHVKGTETWFWTSQWTVPSVWSRQTATFTPASTVAYIKLKSEWWGAGPGTAPVYADNLALRYYLTPEPVLALGGPENVQSGPIVSTLSLNPASLVGGGTSTATVALNGAAPSTGASVTLTSGNTAVATVPSSVTIAAGATSATFPVSTVSVGSPTQVTLTATYNASVQSTSLTVNPNSVATLALDPTSVIGGTNGTSTASLTLTGPAPTGGAVVALSSSNTSAATVPSNVTIPAGGNSASFMITTLAVSTPSPVTISAAYNGTQKVILTVDPPAAALASVGVNPTSVVGGNSSTATVTMTSIAPAGGALVTLTSNNTAAATVPASVTVAAGSNSATFQVSTSPVSSTTPVLVSGTYNSATQSAALTVNPLAVSSVSLNPAALIGGASSTATVTLNSAAPVGGTLVSLSSGNTAVATVPASVTVPAGATTATFAVSTSLVATATAVSINATYNTTQSSTLTVNPIVISAVSLNPTSLIGSATATGTVTLNSTAPPSGLVVSLTSGNPAIVLVPTNVTVPSGSVSANFAISTNIVSAATPVSLTGTYNSSSQSATLTVAPLAIASFGLNPSSLIGGATSLGTVTLNAVAPAGGALVSLTSSNTSAAAVPANVTVPAGAVTASFTISTSIVATAAQSTITSSYNGSSNSLILSVNVNPSGLPWWGSAWAARSRVTVKNGSTNAVLPVHYSAQTQLNTSSLIAAGQMLSNCSDLRVVYFDGTANNEIDRVIENCGATTTTVWFSLQRQIAASALDASYYLYYGNASATPAPANGMNVFLFFEDWENGPAHWINAGGLDPANGGTMGTTAAATDDAFSPTHSQKFSQKTYGGDAFSGLIPVTPGTRYAVSVWAKSATGAYLPVGFDPYNSTKVKGTEVWLWTNAWTIPAVWTQRTGTFTAGSTASFIKLKTEWWGEGPGTAPVYVDNLVLRYSLATEPTLTLGSQEGNPSH
ncbi:MAG TPA: DUF2341 domain-containing protein, partial [Dongiaceae bacterium]|nr:DUF2341 domain-containing protein [Dongiaceae bacterium]